MTRVGFQGELGAFSEEASVALCPEARPIAYPTFEAVVASVQRGETDAGVLPVENTLVGTVLRAYDALAASDLSVVSETAIPIRHFLLGLPGATVSALREARSHPVALDQCRGFLERHPDILAQSYYDTAGAAKSVAAAGDKGLAAIASGRAGTRYGLHVVEADIQDRSDNQTRFFLVTGGVSSGVGPGLLKSAWVVELEHRSGTLYELLGVFSLRGLSLTHLVSRPGGTPWTYRFVVEFVHPSRADEEAAREEALGQDARVRALGTFPAWGEVDASSADVGVDDRTATA